MNKFINSILNSYNSDSSHVKVAGMYKGMKFAGLVTSIRAKYGNDIQVTVEDALYSTYLIDGSTLYERGNGIFENLQVQFAE